MSGFFNTAFSPTMMANPYTSQMPMFRDVLAPVNPSALPTWAPAGGFDPFTTPFMPATTVLPNPLAGIDPFTGLVAADPLNTAINGLLSGTGTLPTAYPALGLPIVGQNPLSLVDQILGGVAPTTTLASGLGSVDSILAGLLGGAAPAAGINDADALLANLLGGQATATATAGTGVEGLLSSLLGQTGAVATATATTGTSLEALLTKLLAGQTGATATAAATTDSLAGLDLSLLEKLLAKKTETVADKTTLVDVTPATTIVKPTESIVKTTSNPTDMVVTDVAGGKQNITWGDPHFEYFDEKGVKKYYDFQGKPNTWFSLVEDGTLGVNAHFKAYGGAGATVMDKMGFKINGKEITYDAKGVPTLNGKPIEAGKEYKFGSGVKDQNGKDIAATVSWDKKSNTLVVNTGEYHFVIKKEADYIRLLSQATSAGVFANGRAADGVLGRAFNPEFANFGKDGKRGASAQGEGFLDKKMEDYIVEGPFGDAAAVKDAETKARWGVLSGGKGAGAA